MKRRDALTSLFVLPTLGFVRPAIAATPVTPPAPYIEPKWENRQAFLRQTVNKPGCVDSLYDIWYDGTNGYGRGSSQWYMPSSIHDDAKILAMPDSDVQLLEWQTEIGDALLSKIDPTSMRSDAVRARVQRMHYVIRRRRELRSSPTA